MTYYEEQAAKVAKWQRDAGWSEESIAMYAAEQKASTCDEDGTLHPGISLGASLAGDNSRFGVVNKEYPE